MTGPQRKERRLKTNSRTEESIHVIKGRKGYLVVQKNRDGTVTILSLSKGMERLFDGVDDDDPESLIIWDGANLMNTLYTFGHQQPPGFDPRLTERRK